MSTERERHLYRVASPLLAKAESALHDVYEGLSDSDAMVRRYVVDALSAFHERRDPLSPCAAAWGVAEGLEHRAAERLGDVYDAVQAALLVAYESDI